MFLNSEIMSKIEDIHSNIIVKYQFIENIFDSIYIYIYIYIYMYIYRFGRCY